MQKYRFLGTLARDGGSRDTECYAEGGTIIKHQKAKRNALILTGVPQDIQKELSAFIKEVRETKFYQADGNPDPRWHLTNDETPGQAWHKAWQEVVDEFGRDVFGSGRLTDGPVSYIYRSVEGFEEMFFNGKELDESRRLTAVLSGSGRRDAFEAVSNALLAAVKSVMPKGCPMNGIFATMQSLAYVILTSDLEFLGKERIADEARAGWKVYQKGYGLFGTVDGKYYVFYGSRLPSKEELAELRKALRRQDDFLT